MSSRSDQRLRLGDLAHAAVALLVCGAYPAALGFFAASLLIVLARDAVPQQARKLYSTLALISLVGLTLLFRGTPAIRPWSEFAAAWSLEFLGLSYCFLRVVYALFDPRSWDVASLLRYYFFAPTFVSGPIMAPGDTTDPVGEVTRGDLSEGTIRILYGVLKVAVATCLGQIIPLSSAWQLQYFLNAHLAPDGGSVSLLWAGVFASGVWLYLEFSGLSDVFIGAARLCGVRASENFLRPYAACDITSFWRRWHASLAAWLRSMVYTPLSKWALRRWPVALVGATAPVVTMIVCGLWHRVSWPFFVWGCMHGAALGLHSLWSRLATPHISDQRRSSAPYRATSWTFTHGFVTASWVFFLPVDGVPFEARLDLLGFLLGVGR